MTIHIFNHREKEYIAWLSKNQSSYVLNVGRHLGMGYISIHMANCNHISNYSNDMANDAFTGKGYIKVGSHSVEELYLWMLSKGYKKFSKVCKSCKPDFKSITPPRRSEGSEAAKHTDELAIKGNKYPKAKVTKTITYERSEEVKKAVLKRAKGFCGGCKQKAPFDRASDGSPYLEVHHKILLSDGGPDTIKNAIALCPNCHRKRHFG